MNMRFASAGAVALILLLSGCKVTLYSHLSEYEANQMLALLMANQINAAKQIDKGGALLLRVEKSQFIHAVEILRQNGYPRPQYASVMDVFPSNQLISSPEQERAKMNYLKEQRIEAMLMSIDGVITAHASIGNASPGGLGGDTIKPTVSVFIKYSPAVNLITREQQIRDLVRQSVPGTEEDRISVVMAPAAYRYVPAQQAPLSGWAKLARNMLWFGGLAALLCTLTGAAIGFLKWYPARRAR
jgi:type III secretion protein J